MVDDLRYAVGYYQRVLGFDPGDFHGDPPRSALLRRGDAEILLQQGPAGAAYSHRRHALWSWDAFVRVPDVGRLHSELAARGADIVVGVGMTDISPAAFEVRDCSSNVICFGLRESGPLRGAAHAALELVPPLARFGWRNWRAAHQERAHLRELAGFYQQLGDTRDVFYAFFTSGLLHWVAHAERHVPRDVNLVLLGSGLTAAERQWIQANIDRPFHHIRLGIDPNTAWEFLFRVNRRHFGWLDIDCFVLNGELFREIAVVEPGSALNCAWSYDSGFGFRIGNTYLAFLNADAIAALRAADPAISPAAYGWHGERWTFMHPRCYARVLTARQRRLLLEVVPPDERGRPSVPAGNHFFDTLVVYQLAARTLGFGLRQVRELLHRVASADDGIVGAQQEASKELLHVGGISYYGSYFHEPMARAMYLAADYALLANLHERLPADYARRMGALGAELQRLGIPPATARSRLLKYIASAYGLESGTADRLLRLADAR